MNPEKDKKFIRRLGKKPDPGESRPIQIVFYNQNKKTEILRNCYKLTNCREWFNGISVLPDLTEQQRKDEVRLRKEVDKKNSELTEEESF